MTRCYYPSRRLRACLRSFPNPVPTAVLTVSGFPRSSGFLPPIRPRDVRSLSLFCSYLQGAIPVFVCRARSRVSSVGQSPHLSPSPSCCPLVCHVVSKPQRSRTQGPGLMARQACLVFLPGLPKELPEVRRALSLSPYVGQSRSLVSPGPGLSCVRPQRSRTQDPGLIPAGCLVFLSGTPKEFPSLQAHRSCLRFWSYPRRVPKFVVFSDLRPLAATLLPLVLSAQEPPYQEFPRYDPRQALSDDL